MALACGGACVPQDRNHCGGCTAKCGATETCTDPVTGSPFMKCLECSGRFPHAGVCGELCVDLDNDALNCGRCGNNCRVTEPACRGKLCMCQLVPRHRGDDRIHAAARLPRCGAGIG